jgi:uncharacterized repeat protein (TIGR03803 family)
MLLSVPTHFERVGAQTFATIYNFSPGITNSDGGGPSCTLLLSGNILYGTAALGGSSAMGTIFRLNTDGSGFTTLHSFSWAPDLDPVNTDGINPKEGLTLSGNTLYGTAFSGGSGANGTVFSVTTSGDNFQTLYSFTRFATSFPTNSDGAKPFAELVVSGNVIYGSTYGGGPTDYGTLFKVNSDGSGFAVFDSVTNVGSGASALVLSNNVLYGTTVVGRSSTNGTVFSINVDGTGLTALYNFTGGTDGAQPRAGLLLSGNVLYGTTTGGGASGQGTVFKLKSDGTGFATLHAFAGTEGTPNRGALVLVGHNLFGIAAVFPQGGTVYTLNTNGTGFTVLHRFTGPGDPTGGQPLGGLAASGSMLYGTTSLGGGYGTMFRISLLPQLAIVPLGHNFVLTWPTNYAGLDYTGYTLQSTTNLSSPVWTTNFPAPLVVNGQCVVTNPISATQQFFRLSQ